MRGLVIASALVLACLTGMAASQPAAAPPPASQAGRSCFFVTQFDNWRAQDPNTMYIRVNMNKYYRLDMSGSCPALLWPDAHLIMNVRGPDTICSPLDWDLKVSTGLHGIPMPCIVKTMTPLTPDQAAAIPKKFKP
ncbi:MAG TPA: DUF6491 family protein [Rhizomicrobium sp.]|nr:DUF6491 family protein [Rhizomicrobium sp.]